DRRESSHRFSNHCDWSKTMQVLLSDSLEATVGVTQSRRADDEQKIVSHNGSNQYSCNEYIRSFLIDRRYPQ
ncbi:hypothetical protein, partial [Enterococcus sp.]|uniref:hypothetical protein n=1 Tax=Enterococcus sp. TaxID=35783 RepID=UPI003995063F